MGRSPGVCELGWEHPWSAARGSAVAEQLPDTAPCSPSLFLPASVLCSIRIDYVLHLFLLRPLQKCHIYLLENLQL